MCTIDDAGNATSTCHTTDLADGHDLSGKEDDVRDMDHLRTRRDGFFDRTHECCRVLQWRRYGYLLEHDAIAPNALIPRRQHPWIIVRRREHLVTALQRHAELNVLQRFTGVARNGNFRRSYAEHGCQSKANGLLLRLHLLPKNLGRKTVGLFRHPT